jgi:phosphoglycolate phosphatase
MARTVILFDLDGTLVDSAYDIAEALTILSRARGGAPIKAEVVRPLVSLGATTLVARALGPFAGDPQQDLAAFRAILLGSPPNRAAIFPHVEQTLDDLAKDGRRLAIVTNKPQSLAVTLLAAHDLARFFAAVIGGDTAAKPKPDPAPLRTALAALEAAPEHSLFVGDSWVDAAAAQSLAIPLLLHTGGYGVDDIADGLVAARFDSFVELPALVAAFAS